MKRRRTKGDWVHRVLGFGTAQVPISVAANSAKAVDLVSQLAVIERSDDITVDRVILEYVCSRDASGGAMITASLGIRKWPTTTLFPDQVTQTPIPGPLDPYQGDVDAQWLMRRIFVLPTGNVFYPTPEGGATEPFSAVIQTRVRTRLKADDRLLLVLTNYNAGGGAAFQFFMRSSCYVLS